MRKQNIRFQKLGSSGITLIALVVTIIVLMILSGVVVATLMGNNGLITRSGEAKESQRGATVQDEVKLALSQNKVTEEINKTTGATGGLKTKANVIEELAEKGYLRENEVEFLEEEDIITIGSVTIDFSGLAGGDGSEIINSVTKTGDINIKFSIRGRTVNETTPPNPDASIFEYLEGTIDSGYVIRDKTTGTPTSGNEFVWVPVKADQKIKLEVTSSADITSITLKDPYNQTMNLGISGTIGTSYKNTNITPTKNGGYTVTVATASGSETATLVVRSLYAQDAFNDYSSAKGKATSNYTDSVDYSSSVNTNGGFYIARYEAGATTPRTSGSSSATVDSIKTANGVPTSKADQTPYNYITQDQARQLAESMYLGASFTCTLPTGAAWDRTLGWLVNTNNKTLANVSTDSSDWGNYNNVSFAITRGKYSTNHGSSYTAVSGSYTKPASSVLLTTGAAPTRNVSNNIFDLAGNVYEWTTEAYGSNLVYRGGSYFITGSSYPSSVRYSHSATDTIYGVGFRPALYL